MQVSSAKRWLIVMGTVITQMALGTIYTWSLFNQPLGAKFGWDLSSVSMTFSITSFALAFATLFAGKLQERFGIRKLVMVSGIILGGGLMLTSVSSSLWMIYLFMGIIVGFADGLAYITTLSNLIKWFPNHKGVASSISVGAYGIGSLIFKYIDGSLIKSQGVSATFLYWGIIALIMIVAGSFLLRDAVVTASPVQKTGNQKAVRDYSVGEMMRTKEVYLLFIIFFTACMSGLYLIGIVKDIGVKLAGLDAGVAANAVAMVAIFNIMGRIILGSLSDRVSRMKIIAGTLVAIGIAVAVLNYVPLSESLFFICVAVIAFCFGGNITIFPAIAADFFGLKNQTKNYGVIYQGFGLGALMGSLLSAIFGGFQVTFVVIIVLCAVSLIATYIVSGSHKKQKKLVPKIA